MLSHPQAARKSIQNKPTAENRIGCMLRMAIPVVSFCKPGVCYAGMLIIILPTILPAHLLDNSALRPVGKMGKIN
jgi:hypothetical protein